MTLKKSASGGGISFKKSEKAQEKNRKIVDFTAIFSTLDNFISIHNNQKNSLGTLLKNAPSGQDKYKGRN
jgi:hypothetical protein